MNKNILVLLFGGMLTTLSLSINAATVSESDSFSPVLIVDSSTSSTGLTFTDTGTITDVNVFINFTKCGSSISSSGACGGPGLSFNREIEFSLTSALGTVVDLVLEDTYSGQSPGATVGVLFDDDAASPVGGSFLSSGSFSPVGSLSDFNGENLLGIWTLSFTDTVGADPLSLNSWRLDITAETSAVPVPAAVWLLGSGLMGLLGMRKNASKGSVISA